MIQSISLYDIAAAVSAVDGCFLVDELTLLNHKRTNERELMIIFGTFKPKTIYIWRATFLDWSQSSNWFPKAKKHKNYRRFTEPQRFVQADICNFIFFFCAILWFYITALAFYDEDSPNKLSKFRVEPFLLKREKLPFFFSLLIFLTQSICMIAH